MSLFYYVRWKFRLKKINPMSQSCRAHLFFGARLIRQNSRFEFFWLAWFFFFSFLRLACQKIQEKIWHMQWNTLNNKLLQLLCSALYLVHPKSSSICQSCDRLKSDTFAAQKKKKKKNVKKTAFRSGLEICHELWDIAFTFFSLIYNWTILLRLILQNLTLKHKFLYWMCQPDIMEIVHIVCTTKCWYQVIPPTFLNQIYLDQPTSKIYNVQ